MNLKIVILFTILILGFYCSNAQDKIEKFCHVQLSGGRIYMDFGKSYERFKDSTEIKKLLQLKYVKNVVDVLDYMTNQGWSLVSTVDDYNTGIICYFKKTFNASEFITGEDNIFKKKKN